MNSDQWSMFLVFCKTIDIDFSEYDNDSAWPLMLDDFVTFMRHKRQVSVCEVISKPRKKEVARFSFPQWNDTLSQLQLGEQAGFPEEPPGNSESSDVEMADL